MRAIENIRVIVLECALAPIFVDQIVKAQLERGHRVNLDMVSHRCLVLLISFRNDVVNVKLFSQLLREIHLVLLGTLLLLLHRDDVSFHSWPTIGCLSILAGWDLHSVLLLRGVDGSRDSEISSVKSLPLHVDFTLHQEVLNVSFKLVLVLFLITMLTMDVLHDDIVSDIDLLVAPILCNGRRLLTDTQGLGILKSRRQFGDVIGFHTHFRNLTILEFVGTNDLPPSLRLLPCSYLGILLPF